MQKLALEDTKHLQAAYGWIGSGNHQAALAELDKIAPEFNEHPAILTARLSIAETGRQWETCVDLAESLIGIQPENPIFWVQRSVFLRDLGRVQEAWDKLLPAAEKFPAFWMIPYGLAGHACRLGKLEDAWKQMEAALQLVDAQAVKAKALVDADLQPLWPRIRAI